MFYVKYVHTCVAIKIDFSRKVYYAVESRGYVVIEILSLGWMSTNPITLTVIPIEQSPISAAGIIYTLYSYVIF